MRQPRYRALSDKAMSYDCSCDYVAPTFYNQSLRTAKKQHKCEECGGPILAGEKYEYVSGLWDGYFNVFKTCERCVDIRTWTKNNVPCLCWTHGNADEDCREAVSEATYRAPDETTGLRFGLLRRMAMRDKFNSERRKALSPTQHQTD